MMRKSLLALAASLTILCARADVAAVADLAADWAEAQSRASLAAGVALTPAQAAVAREVGVREPGKVRLHVVEALPAPREPTLTMAAGRIGLMPQAADGMTLGHAVLVKRGAEDDARLLRHELRHVAQYEQAGGIRAFLAAHIPDLLRYGYRDSPYERDARAHERRAPAASPD
jgi:hypothetical protein